MHRDRHVGRAGVVLLVLVAVAAFAPGAQAANGVRVSCGQTITKDTKLANNLVNCPGNGIIIGAPNVTLDLNGHVIDGNGHGAVTDPCPEHESCDVGVVNSASVGGHAFNRPGHNGVTIKNGTIRQFAEEPVFALSVRNNLLRNLTLSDSEHGVVWCATAHSRIEEVRAKANLLGILVGGCGVSPSHHVRIENSSVSENRFDGIVLGLSHHLSVRRNTVSMNGRSGGTAGIYVQGDSALVSSNTISRNGSVGVFVEGHATRVSFNRVSHNRDVNIGVFGNRNTIVANRVSDALGCPGIPDCGSGILIFGGERNHVLRNDVSRALVDGIQIQAFEPDVPTLDTVLRDNRVRASGVDGVSVGATGAGTVSRTLLRGNVVADSGDDGFDVRSAATTLFRNVATRNHDFGIDAVPGVRDAGGNRARGNGNALQCRNVFCG